jgi:uncharacterized protein YpmB
MEAIIQIIGGLILAIILAIAYVHWEDRRIAREEARQKQETNPNACSQF